MVLLCKYIFYMSCFSVFPAHGVTMAPATYIYLFLQQTKNTCMEELKETFQVQIRSENDWISYINFLP